MTLEKPIQFLAAAMLLSTASVHVNAAQSIIGYGTCQVEIGGSLDYTPQGRYSSCDYAPVRTSTTLDASADRKIIGTYDYGTANQLNIFVSAESLYNVNASPGHLQVRSSSRFVEQEGAVSAQSNSNAGTRYIDSLVVQSDAHKPGDVVSLELRYSLGFSTSWLGKPSGVGAYDRFEYEIQADFRLDDTTHGKISGVQVNNGTNSQSGPIFHPNVIFVEDNHQISQPDFVFIQIVNAVVGDTLELNYSIDGRTFARGALSYERGAVYNGSADVFATFFYGLGADLYLTPLDSTVRLSASSSHDYSLPVPENSTGSLFILGVTALCIFKVCNDKCNCDAMQP